MQDSLTSEPTLNQRRRPSFEETELERRATKFNFGAPVTGSVTIGDSVAVGFGDGNVRIFREGVGYSTTKAHAGVVLCMATDGEDIFTGSDDGKFLRISSDNTVEEIASFGTKWVDCVAVIDGKYACSSGGKAHVWSKGQKGPSVLEHSSTVGGMAFDAKGKRLAVAHYGGVTIWEAKERRWKSSKLIWKGFHGAVCFSPDGKYVVTAMQENALHGWRLRDKGDLAMSGYPAKVKSFAWVGNTPYLVTSGANEAICWPFDGKDGPMGRAPVCVAPSKKQIATCVQALTTESAVFAGFRDGSVLLAEIDESKEPIVIKGSSGSAITGISLTSSLSHVLVGDEEGNVLWSTLWAGEMNAKSI